MMNTKDKIEVMQAGVNGKQLQLRRGCHRDWVDVVMESTLEWAWGEFQYRIKPVAPRTVFIVDYAGSRVGGDVGRVFHDLGSAHRFHSGESPIAEFKEVINE